MSEHSVVEAKNNLSDLIDRALKGEAVVITRHGKPMVELKALVSPGREITPEDIAWLSARRVPRRNSQMNSGEIVSAMRDEDDERLLRR
ncbi:MAG: type II toxin-antitoxin system Phd/YefM family antitoxin [Phenylobacterium sp.]|uniref:type II toxin-antitoxin system Phd/YefM family antitoxin n=1 Tax=Phenylobacterium sp. TaxID=1871053 RepID=UPI0027177872|nr:type II toxin-antitoxin system Phd/YefM family antitoxin [Phenylobacterium sp.]MDO8913793.1 type II toxin-antitoxin system Phd/YefM family antitoxin [Phenylobacterium sp.]MDO9247762.1 type II toxin-antitoxin system Phd/YefM family antitoxin [Phenylobacterium sp.]MDP2008883.1 type II toxin-antitoxin system Phd/YefM family antitoxin [Phenylobacterium sp.]MDP3100524.1 type II toxin-antitoxin system Phd/YefM family antitoxin [Phenylobacterium sp.]MDP3635669.1 type II toxin-antitoxin system Phd/